MLKLAGIFLFVLWTAKALPSCNLKSLVRKFPRCLRASSRLHMSPKIALTREDGANSKLASLLSDLNCIELPCIQFGPGTDNHKITDELLKNDVIVVTSPQAANVLIQAWEESGKPNVCIATVGSGTSKVLKAKGIIPDFEPTDSTAETLANELPTKLGPKVLYPASAIAENKLQDGLEKRGFQVSRLNTYTTVPAVWTSEQLNIAKSIDIVTFASPSTVKAWAERLGTDFAAVVIGPTSQKAAEKAGFREVFVPEGGSKGLEPWAQLIREVANRLSAGVGP